VSVSFRKAERKKAKARVGLSGPAGSGKTFSALEIAFGLGGPVALIDTENGSGDLYAHLGEYDVLTLQAPFTPEKYIEGIKAAEEAGYNVLVIDSLSHAWAGEGGILDIQGKITDASRSGNGYTAWRQVTPRQNAMVEAILQSKMHIIATMRSKTEYALTTDDRGKQTPKKIGLAPVQRDGMEYEFTVFLDLSQEHIATASKDRTSLFDGQYFKPSRETGKQLLAWLEDGVEAPEPAPTPAEEAPVQQEAAAAVDSPSDDGVFICSECAGPLTQGAFTISMRKYGRALCAKCQKTVGGAAQ
jgi:hypothetical protein